MDLQNILSNLDKVKSLFENCDKCGKQCNDQQKISACGHIYCAKCILSINTCVKCGIKYAPKEIYAHRADEDNIIQCFNRLKTLLQTETIGNNNCEAVRPSSLITITNETSTNETNIIDDVYIDATCDCTSYLQITTGKQTNDKKELLVNKKNAVGETKLFHACKKGNEKEVKELLEAGALVNVQDYAGWTPLHEAVYSRNLSIVENLLKLGSVVNAPGDLYDTPLHKAVETNNPEMVQLLIKYGADVNSRNYEGNTPFDVALPDLKKTMKSMKSEIKIIKKTEFKQKYIFYILGNKENDFIEIINRFSNKLIPISNANTLNENVTHVISTNTSKLLEPSYELLHAIALQIPVISHEWLTACLALNKIIDYEEYYIIGTNDIAENVIYKTQLNKYKLNPKLFSGCHFFIANTSPSTTYKLNDKLITKEQLLKLIIAAGGKILKREPHLTTISSYLNRFPWHAEPASIIEQCCHYIVYIPSPPNESRQEMKYNMKELRHVPYTWLFECIFQYRLINPTFM